MFAKDIPQRDIDPTRRRYVPSVGMLKIHQALPELVHFQRILPQQKLLMADCIPGYFRQGNGGVHRGIFNGESYYQLQVVDDETVSDELLRSANLAESVVVECR